MSFTSPHSRRRPARRATQSLPAYVFIAYAGLPAARDAIERMKQMLGRTLHARSLQPMLWRFDQLGKPRWCEMALHDALRAHAIVLAMGDAPSLDSGTDEWLTRLANRRAGVPTNCLVFMNDDDAWTISLQRSESVQLSHESRDVRDSELRRPRRAPRPSFRSLR